MDRRFNFNFSNDEASYNLAFEAGNVVVLRVWWVSPGKFATEMYGLTRILDFLKEHAPEHFTEVQKFCFEHI